MAAARATNPTGAPAGVASGTENLLPNGRIINTTHVRFAGDETVFAAPLVGVPAQEYNFEAKLAEARLLLDAGKKDKARTVFTGIIVNLNTTQAPVNSLICARCLLGMAFTYPTGPEKSKWSASAKQELDRIYNNITSEKTYLENKEKKIISSELIENYNVFIFLVPRSDSITREEINGKIKECNRILASVVVAPPLSTPLPGSNSSSLAPPKPAANQNLRRVTSGRINGPSKIRMIFGLAIIAIVASIASVVIYKRYFVRK